MSDLSVILLTTNSKDGAVKALDTVKRLDHEGWIELIDYALISKDEKGHTTVREADDEFAEDVTVSTLSFAGGVIGVGIGGPAGAVAGAVAGAAAAIESMRVKERLVQSRFLEEIPESLTVNSSALAVVVEERYVQRLDEELEKFGPTSQRKMMQIEREAELRAHIKRSKEGIASLQNNIKTRLANAKSSTQTERARIEAEIAADRAELEMRRERLEDQIKAMNSYLQSEIREMNLRLELAGQAGKAGIALSLDHLHRELNGFTDELQDLIEGHIGMLNEEASELKTKAVNASGQAKNAIENHLSAVEGHVRKEHAKMRASFEERLLQTRQWFEILQVRSALGKADLRDNLQAGITAAQHAFAELKASARARKHQDERAWKDIRSGCNKAWRDLADAFDRAHHERS